MGDGDVVAAVGGAHALVVSLYGFKKHKINTLFPFTPFKVFLKKEGNHTLELASIESKENPLG